MTKTLPTPKDIKLIVCDVDGTLLTSEHNIHPRTVAAFHKLRTSHPDLPVVIASGKQRNSCMWIREALRLPPYFPSAHCNGAIIYGGSASDGILRQNGLSPQVVQHIVAGTPQFGTFLFTEDLALLVSEGEGVNRKNWCEIGAKYDVGVRDCTREPQHSQVFRQVINGELVVSKVTICVDESDIDAARSLIEALPLTSPSPFTITRAIPFIFEAIAPNVHKGTALEQICESLEEKIPLEQVLVFGDGENDICVFERAGHAVAMSNAMPLAIEAAHYTTASNDEGGVGQFIEQVWGF